MISIVLINLNVFSIHFSKCLDSFYWDLKLWEYYKTNNYWNQSFYVFYESIVFSSDLLLCWSIDLSSVSLCWQLLTL